MPSARQQRGSVAEAKATDFLRRHNFEILGQHVTSRYGEIDILARERNTIVAVEVKLRRNANFGTATESVTATKIRRITTAVYDVLERMHLQTEDIRIDLITLDSSSPGKARIRHYRGIT